MFPEIPDIFSKYLAFSPKYFEKILNMPNIFLSFFYKYHNNDFIKSKISFIGKTGMRHSLYKVTASTCEHVQYIATGFLPCLTINGMTFISMGYNIQEENR